MSFLGFPIPLYYFVIALPTCGIVLYALTVQRSHTLWEKLWWLFPLVCLPGIVMGLDPRWSVRQWGSLLLRGVALGASLTCLMDSTRAAERSLSWIYAAVFAACLLGTWELTFNTNPLTDSYINRSAKELGPEENSNNPFFHSPTENSGSSRPQGTQGNRIPYTACLTPLLPLALWRLRSTPKWQARHLIVIFLVIITVIWSQTRGSWIGLLAGFASYAWLIRKRHPQRVRWMTRGAALLLLLGFAFPASRSIILTRTRTFNLQNLDVQHRLASLNVAQGLKGHYLFGVGYGNYPKIYKLYYRGPFPFLDMPDNQYFLWLIENGWIGFGVLVGFVAGLAGACLRRIQTLAEKEQDFYSAVFSGWVAIAATFLFFDGFYWIGPNMMFWCLLGVLATCLREPYAVPH